MEPLVFGIRIHVPSRQPIRQIFTRYSVMLSEQNQSKILSESTDSENCQLQWQYTDALIHHW